MSEFVKNFRDLRVYKRAFKAAFQVFQITKKFPIEEKYSMVDQIRRSSRSVCANLAEAWYKRRYIAAFTAKLSDSTSEAAETQVWLEMALACEYLSKEEYELLQDEYEKVIGQLVKMIQTPDSWIIK